MSDSEQLEREAEEARSIGKSGSGFQNTGGESQS